MCFHDHRYWNSYSLTRFFVRASYVSHRNSEFALHTMFCFRWTKQHSLVPFLPIICCQVCCQLSSVYCNWTPVMCRFVVCLLWQKWFFPSSFSCVATLDVRWRNQFSSETCRCKLSAVGIWQCGMFVLWVVSNKEYTSVLAVPFLFCIQCWFFASLSELRQRQALLTDVHMTTHIAACKCRS